MKKKGWTDEAVVFFEEIPIRGKVKEIGHDPLNNAVDWEIEEKLVLPVSKSRQFFIRRGGRTFSVDVVYQEGKVVTTTAPVPRYDPRFKRKQIRVTTSLSNPVEAFIADYYAVDLNSGKQYRVFDISEYGISVLTKPKDPLFQINNELIVSLLLTYGGRKVSVSTKGKVVRLERVRDDVEKAGIYFFDISPRDRDLIAGYINARQREIIQNIQRIKW